MSSDVPRARELLDGAIFCFEHRSYDDGLRRLREARAMMTRTVNKVPVRLGNKMTPAIRARIVELLTSRTDLADVEISEMAFGNAGGAGRVSEIRAGLA